MPCSALQDSTRGQSRVCDNPPSYTSLLLSHVLALDDHFFDELTARTCNGHPLPCSGTNASVCVSEADAASVFAIGDFEYECVFPCRLPHQQLTHCDWLAISGTTPKTHRRTRYSHSVRSSLILFVWGTDSIRECRRVLCGARGRACGAYVWASS
jgi:hypothetical protein